MGLKDLSENQQSIISLYEQGYSLKEISEKIGMPEKLTNINYYYAASKLNGDILNIDSELNERQKKELVEALNALTNHLRDLNQLENGKLNETSFNPNDLINLCQEISDKVGGAFNKNEFVSLIADYTIKEKLRFATDRERQAYFYRREGKTFKAIAELMGISNSGAQRIYYRAERRIREYDLYYKREQEMKEKNSQPIDISLTYGDGILITDALMKIIKNCEKENNIMLDLCNKNREENKSKLPYEYFLIRELYNRFAPVLDLPSYKF